MPALKSLHLFGVNFRTAPVAVRESLTVNRRESAKLLRSVATSDPGLEAVVLSTCNRTELYVAVDAAAQPIENRLPGALRRRVAELVATDAAYHRRGQLAVRHLCRVACGLDSAVLGDAQILGQVKAALSDAGCAGSLGNIMHHAFRCAVSAGRQARNNTGISTGTASVGAALADLIAHRRPNGLVGGRAVVVLGAGKVAAQVSRQLAKRGLRPLTIINRTPANAAKIAAECGGRTAPWYDRESRMREADVIVAACGSAKPVVSRDMLARVARGRKDLLVVDAGLPRNVEVVPDVEIMNVDAICERQEAGLLERRAAVPAVERLIDEAVGAWVAWCDAQPLESAIKDLFAEVRRVSERHADSLARLRGLSAGEAETELVKEFKRHLHPFVRELRAHWTVSGRGGTPAVS